jgi:4-amino-4-deoxy-L-arabinose transferase-like glycosyltransferase
MRGPVALLLVVTLLRLYVAATTGIVDDEAYYWVWSQHLAAGYYDHPPGIAWLIAPFAAIFGPTSFGVRAGPVLASAAAAAMLLPYARDRWLFVLIFAATPLLCLGGLLATPDAPLVFGWALALGGAFRAVSGDPRAWLVAGLGVGIAGLGKYTGWGIWPLILAGVASLRVFPAGGADLPAAGGGEASQGRGPWLLGGLLVTLLALAPNLAWNAAHDWISVKFQAGHGLGGQGATSHEAPGWLGALELLGAQAGLVTPVLFGAAVAFWVRPGRDAISRLAWWTSLPVLVFFTLAATIARGEPNWAAPAWIGAAVGLSRAGPRVRRAAWVGSGLAAVVTLLAFVHLYRPVIALPGDPTARLGAGAVLAESVQAWGVEPVYTERYQEAAVIRYYQGLEAYALPGVGRADQYDLWPTPWSGHALVVRPWRGGDGMPTDRFCADRGEREVVTERSDTEILGRWQVAEVWGCAAELTPTEESR